MQSPSSSSADHGRVIPGRAIAGDRSRREFFRDVGGAAFAILLVDIADNSLRSAYAQDGCGTGTSDANCNVSGAPDQNCGQAASAGFNTGGPAGTDRDEACSLTDNDGNCSIAQLPKANDNKDPDQNCAKMSEDADQSCGDCDDNHEADERCGKSPPGGGMKDADELCGHESGVGLDTDDVCSATDVDSGCGKHSTTYGGLPNNDVDQHCVVPNADLNCSSLDADNNCNMKTFPSTTSPDENCGQPSGGGIDSDEACSHYDMDESCSGTSEDEACGKWPGILVNDADQCCPTESQDQSDEEQKGPLNPWCGTDDPDYWNPTT